MRKKRHTVKLIDYCCWTIPAVQSSYLPANHNVSELNLPTKVHKYNFRPFCDKICVNSTSQLESGNLYDQLWHRTSSCGYPRDSCNNAKRSIGFCQFYSLHYHVHSAFVVLREGILRKNCCSFGFCPNEGVGGGPCPIFFGTFSKAHFWSIKGVYFFQNANN